MPFLICFFGYLLMSHDSFAQINSAHFPFKDSYLIRGTLTDAAVLNLNPNLDYLPDVIVADYMNDNISFFNNIGGCPNSLSRGSLMATGDGPIALEVADFDNNGREDFVVLNELSKNISVYDNYIDINHAVSIFNAGTYPVGDSPQAIKTEDIDQDGKPDLLVTHNNGLVYIFRNTSTAAEIQFDEAFILDTNKELKSIALGELNGDDKSDLLLAAVSNGGYLLLFENQSTPGLINFLPVIEKNMDFSPTALFVADIDGDNKKDVLMGGLNDPRLLLWHNEFSNGVLSTTSLGSPLYFQTASGISDIEIADLDGNQKAEVLLLHPAIDSLTVLTNNFIDGEWNATLFLAPVTLFVGDEPTALLVADINVDGKKDLVNTTHDFRNLTVQYAKQSHCTDANLQFPAIAAHYYSRYNPGDFVLTAAGSGLLTWYGDSTLTQLMGSGIQFQTPWLEHTDTFYVTNSVSCCESESVAVVASIQCAINPPAAVSNYHCGPGIISLQAISNEQVLWYKHFKDTAVIARGPIFTTASLEKSDTFYVAAFKDGCYSKKEKIVASVFPPVKLQTAKAETGLCSSSGIEVSIPASQKNVYYYIMENETLHTYQGNGTILKLGNYPIGTSLQVSASNACDSITLPLLHHDSQLPTIPNLVTANGDGKNDHFTVLNLPSYTQLQVYNSWGAKVFASDAYQNNWGAEEQIGIYFYELQYELCGQLEKHSGWIQLKRNE